MPMPKKMPMSHRLELAGRILKGEFNVIRQTQTMLLEEVTLRNRNQQWYDNKDAGRYPFADMEENDG